MQGSHRRRERQRRRERPEDRPGRHRRQVLGRNLTGEGSGREPERVHRDQRLAVRVPHLPVPERRRGSRRSAAGSTARTTSRRATSIISAYGDGTPVAGITSTPAPRWRRSSGPRSSRDRLRLSPSSTRPPRPPSTTRRRRRPRGGLPEHLGRVRDHRRRSDRARRQELGHRRALPAAGLRHQLRPDPGPPAERRAHEGDASQPGTARTCSTRRSRRPSPTRRVADATSRSRSRTRPRRSSRPT